MKTIKDQLIEHEGLRLKPYKDSVGKLTIGVGRNLDDVGLTHTEAIYLLENDIGRVCYELDGALPWWRTLDLARQQVLIDMGFNMGVPTLLGFVRTLGYIESGMYEQAAEAMLQSKWAQQVGRRAIALAAMMRGSTEV